MEGRKKERRDEWEGRREEERSEGLSERERGERDGEGPFRCASSAALPTQRRHQPPRSALPAPYCMTAGEYTLISWLSRNTNAEQMTVQYRISLPSR